MAVAVTAMGMAMIVMAVSVRMAMVVAVLPMIVVMVVVAVLVTLVVVVGVIVRHGPMSHRDVEGSIGTRPTAASALRVAADRMADHSAIRVSMAASSALAGT